MIEDKIRAGIWGVLVADALGVPHEFKSAVTIRTARIEMVMDASYPKTYPKTPYGTWSDDGALTLALADSLGRVGHLDTQDFGQALVRWYTKSHYTPDNRTYDVGATTSEAICKMIRGHAPESCGMTQETANGNGSLMRTLPIALFHKGSDQELYDDACRQSAVTHAHDISKAACGVYSVAARHILNGKPPARAFIEALPLAHVQLQIPSEPSGSGFVLDSLAFAIQAVRSGKSYEDVVLEAIRLGADTDTTACIAGGLVAVRDGMGAIPSKWLDKLHGRELAARIIKQLVTTQHQV